MNQQALQYIAQEKQQKSGKLDLRDCHLSRLPMELFELETLQELNLQGNYFRDNELYQLIALTNLKTLKLSDKWLYDYDFLLNMPQLQSLTLENPYAINFDYLGDLPNLLFLEVYTSEISEVAFFEKLVDLEHLKLSLKKPKIDYSFLKFLFNLKSLHLSNQNIRDLSFLKHTPYLKVLDVSFNHISNISILQELIYLEQVNLRHNQLKNIESLTQLIQLKEIDVRQNKVKNKLLLPSSCTIHY